MDPEIRFEPMGKSIKVRQGMSVLNAARKAGIHIPTRCGGKAGCLMCKIIVSVEDAYSLSPIGDVELRKLGSLSNQGMRLSCQALIQLPVVVQVPEDRLKAAIRKQLEAAKQNDSDTLW
ncbi:2Fe-2S iron-sulfur cluster-binding protein [Paenibacillus sp. CMAA1364]